MPTTFDQDCRFLSNNSIEMCYMEKLKKLKKHVSGIPDKYLSSMLTEESFDRLVSESLDIFLLGNVTKMLPDASN